MSGEATYHPDLEINAGIKARIQRVEGLSKRYLAERDAGPETFVGIRGRRRNPDYNDGYRMGMEEAARMVRAALAAPTKETDQ